MKHEDSAPWKYKPDKGHAKAAAEDTADQNRAHRAPPKPISWEAPEFIYHKHGVGWYSVLALTTVLLAAIVYVLAKDRIAAGIITALGLIVWIFAGQEPAKARYEVSSSGLRINDKAYGYDNFKSFTVIKEGELASVNLFPIKRLMPTVSAYFDPKESAKIINTIGDFLPYENRQLDGIDRLARRLRL